MKRYLQSGIGAVVSQAVALVSLPVISRLYLQGDIGWWMIAIGIGLIAGSVSTLRYELAIVTDQSENEAMQSLALAFALSAIAAVIFLGFIAMAWSRELLISTDAPGWLVWTIPIFSWCFSLQMIIQALCVRKSMFWESSVAQIATIMVSNVLPIVLALIWTGNLAMLIISNIAGLVLGLIVAWAFLGRKGVELQRVSFQAMVSAGRRGHRFAVYSAPYTLFNAARDRAAAIILQGWATPDIIGRYSYAQFIVLAPVSLVGKFVRPVLFRDGSRGGVSSIEGRVVAIQVLLAIIVTPCFLVFMHSPQECFRMLLGDLWGEAGVYASILAIPAYLAIYCNWLDRTMDVMGKQALTLWLEMGFTTAALLLLIGCLASNCGIVYSLTVFAAVIAIYYASHLVICWHLAKWKWSGFLRVVSVVAALFIFDSLLIYVLMPIFGFWLAAVLIIVVSYVLFGFWFAKMIKVLFRDEPG